MTKISPSNKRAHLRYRDPDSTVIKLYRKGKHNEKDAFVGLIVNESFTGLACVYVGGSDFKKGDELYWEETDQIHTLVHVVRCYPLEEDIFYLALHIAQD